MIMPIQTPPGQYVQNVFVRRPFASTFGSDGIYAPIKITPAPMAWLVVRLATVPADGDVVEVKINATNFQVTKLTGESRADTLTALAVAINGGAEPVTATARGVNELVIKADNASVPFTFETVLSDIVLLGTLTQITASVQPIQSGRAREVLPEAHREKEAVIVFADFLFYGPDERAGRLPDVIEYDNGLGGIDEFEVIMNDHYQMGQMNHDEAVAVRFVRGTSDC